MTGPKRNGRKPRREFVKQSVATLGAMGTLGARGEGAAAAPGPAAGGRVPARPWNGPYTGDLLRHVAFPLGGIGAGTICLEGTGALSHVSSWHCLIRND